MKHSPLIALFVLLLSAASFAQEKVAGNVFVEHAFKSEILGETRKILVDVPAGYAGSEAKYPVVYMLDGGLGQMNVMSSIMESQARAGEIPEMILVGIENNGNRNFDLTPTDNKMGGERGNGEKFMQFVEKELIPYVEKGYRAEKYRVFAGHSFGGLMVAYSLATRPDLFDAYISSSPALHWDDRVVVKLTGELLKQRKELRKSMFMAIANEPGFLGDANALRDVLKKYNPSGFDYEFREYKDETHGSSALIHYYAGLRKIFNGWLAPENAEFFEDVESHYKGLTKRFGFAVPIPEQKFAQFAGQLVQQQKFDEAVEVMKKDIAAYPNSAGAHRALGIVYERNNQPKYARDEYEKAWKLAEAQKNDEMARESKAAFERLAGK